MEYGRTKYEIELQGHLRGKIYLKTRWLYAHYGNYIVQAFVYDDFEMLRFSLQVAMESTLMLFKVVIKQPSTRSGCWVVCGKKPCHSFY